MKSELIHYIDLMRDFGQGRKTAEVFEEEFLSLFKGDATAWSDQEFAVLDDLFASVDRYCADPGLRDEDDLDEAQLLEAVKHAWARLAALG